METRLTRRYHERMAATGMALFPQMLLREACSSLRTDLSPEAVDELAAYLVRQAQAWKLPLPADAYLP